MDLELAKLAEINHQKMKQARSLSILNTKANRRIQDGLYYVVTNMGENYARLSDREFTRICRVSNVTISSHGGIVAIKNACMNRAAYRITGCKKYDLPLMTKQLYDAISSDHRAIDIMLTLEDYHFFIQVFSPFEKFIIANHIGDFFWSMLGWLKNWQRAGYSREQKKFWFALAIMVNKYTSKPCVPANYENF